MSAGSPPKKYEEFAHVLDFTPRGKSTIIKGREGPLAQAIGEDRLILLELLTMNNVVLNPGDRVCISKVGRTKILSVLGRLNYENLTQEARNELPSIVEAIVRANEEKYVAYFNELQPITPRLHALELIPGIGKTFMMQIINQRARKPFTGFDDIQNRIRLRDPARLVAKRIAEEIEGDERVYIFVRG